MKHLLVLFIALGLSSALMAQKHMTRTGVITFHSKTTLETIEARNGQVNGSINLETGEMAFLMLMKAFQFEKALMQEHFNEKYVESDKFPKSTFTGKITNLSELKLDQPEPQKVRVAGDLTLHGVTQRISAEGTLELRAGSIIALSEFPVKVGDFGIKIPAATRDNIAETVTVKVHMEYKPLEPAANR